MGRRRIYNTPEEKASANRAKSKRHYERSKAEINKRRRTAYNQGKELQTSNRQMAPQASQNKEDGVAFMLRKSQRVIDQLRTLLKVPAKEFVESLCADMMATGDLTRAEEYVAAIAPMQRLLDQYHNDILSAKGIGDEWRQVQSMVREVRQVVIWIDDLQVHAMVDKEELRGVYSEGRLIFQK